MSQRESYGFTINLKNLIRIAMNDPKARQEIREAIVEGPMPHTEKLGAANLRADENSPDEWYTVFAGTARDVQPMTSGFLLRNQDGTRISMRLRRQQRKDHAAATPGVTNLDPGQQLLARALSGDQQAAQALLAAVGATAPATQAEPSDDLSDVLPATQEPANEDTISDTVRVQDGLEDLAAREAAVEDNPFQAAAQPPQKSQTVSGEIYDDFEAAVSVSDPEFSEDDTPTL